MLGSQQDPQNAIDKQFKGSVNISHEFLWSQNTRLTQKGISNRNSLGVQYLGTADLRRFVSMINIYYLPLHIVTNYLLSNSLYVEQMAMHALENIDCWLHVRTCGHVSVDSMCKGAGAKHGCLLFCVWNTVAATDTVVDCLECKNMVALTKLHCVFPTRKNHFRVLLARNHENRKMMKQMLIFRRASSKKCLPRCFHMSTNQYTSAWIHYTGTLWGTQTAYHIVEDIQEKLDRISSLFY